MQTITIGNTTLFWVACQYFGDATQWDRIATLNGIRDPWLTALTTLRLPSSKAATGGALGIV